MIAGRMLGVVSARVSALVILLGTLPGCFTTGGFAIGATIDGSKPKDETFSGRKLNRLPHDRTVEVVSRDGSSFRSRFVGYRTFHPAEYALRWHHAAALSLPNPTPRLGATVVVEVGVTASTAEEKRYETVRLVGCVPDGFAVTRDGVTTMSVPVERVSTVTDESGQVWQDSALYSLHERMPYLTLLEFHDREPYPSDYIETVKYEPFRSSKWVGALIGFSLDAAFLALLLGHAH